MPLLISILLAVIPAFLFAAFIYWVDRYEKEPLKMLVGVFLWGALIAGGGAFIINTLLGIGFYTVTGSEALTDLVTGSVVAPIVEESLKGLAVLLVFWRARQEFDSVVDGMVYAGITALGFAAVENAYYIYNYGWLESGWEGIGMLAFIRVVLVGWQHPFYTAFTGIGLALARLSREPVVKWLAIPGGYVVAVFTHSLHNTLAHFLSGLGGLILSSLVDWIQLFLMFAFLIWMLLLERQRIARYLRVDLDSGRINSTQYAVACSAWKQWAARFKAVFNGRFRQVNRFYQVCAELAQKRYQLERFGDEKGNAEAIARYESELQELAEKLAA